MPAILSFPQIVNEKAARVVAGGVALTAAVALLTGAHWLAIPLAYGFLARTLTGPRLSPLAQFATRVAAPRLGPPREVAGPPKRFAQAIGAAMTTAASALWLLGAPAGWVAALLGLLLVAASLEALLAVCLGCRMFAGLMRLGVVPAAVCAECADIWSRPAAQRAHG